MRSGWIAIGIIGALAVGAAAGYFVGVSADAPGVSAAEKVGATVREIYEGPDGVDKLEELTALYAEDAVIDDLANGDHFEGEFEREWANEVFLDTPDLDMVIEEVIAGDGILALTWTATGSDAGGEPFTLPGVTVYKLRDDRVIHEYYYYNERQAPML
ncbi:MAG: nuclear transport factor 2 family protein [Anaerosomatales bacterium]|nr:nuclear transport factor 2 family protein [Anaerosomatales bacterium]